MSEASDLWVGNGATDRQVARAAIRVALRHLGAKGERELHAEIKRVQEDERMLAERRRTVEHRAC